MLMVHTDCGAYGGLQAFGGNEEREAGESRIGIAERCGIPEEQHPPIEIECYYLKFTGVWALEAA